MAFSRKSTQGEGGSELKVYFANGKISKGRFEGSFVHITEVVKYLCGKGHRVYLPPSDCSVGTLLPQNRLFRLPAIFRCDIHYFRFQGRPVLPRWYKLLRRLKVFRQPVVWEMNATTELQNKTLDADVYEGVVRAVAEDSKFVKLAICNTPALARYSQSLGIPLTNVIPLGANPDVFPIRNFEKISDRPLRVTWIGNANIEWHDFETMRQAAIFLADRTDIEFHFLCSYSSELPRNVTLHDPMPYTELASWLGDMDVGLAIYNPESLFEYGIFSSPLKIFDYMSCGLTVVASPIEQVRSLIRDGENGHVVETKSVLHLVERLVALAEDRSSLQSVGEAARSSVLDYYNWSRVGQETETALMDLLP